MNRTPESDRRGFRWLWASIALIAALTLSLALCPEDARAQVVLRPDSTGAVRIWLTRPEPDTVVRVRRDTLVRVDTLRIVRVDTLIQRDTVVRVDTIVRVDTVRVPAPPDTTTPLGEVVGLEVAPASALTLTAGDSATLRIVAAYVVAPGTALQRRLATDAELRAAGVAWTASEGLAYEVAPDSLSAVVRPTVSGNYSAQACIGRACAFRGVLVAERPPPEVPVDTIAPVPADTMPPVAVPPVDAIAPLPPIVGPAELPELPRIVPEPGPVPAPTGRTFRPLDGDALQAALDSARGGDEIVLAAGQTYLRYGFRLPARPADDTAWVVVRTDALDSLPPYGERVTPTHAAHLPDLLNTIPGEPAIATAPGAHHWRLVGLEVFAIDSTARVGTFLALGSGGREQDTLEEIPHHLVLDRLYVHGSTVQNVQRCLAMHTGWTAIVGNWFAECHAKGYDSQAIVGWNGSGPYLITNNHLAGAGENVMFGGADPAIDGMLPRDITFTRNHVHKPESWYRSDAWSVKNLFELKIGQRVLVEGNVFDGSWTDAQTGFWAVIKSTNQQGRATWSNTRDVTVRLNHAVNVEAGMSFAGAPEKPAVPANHILVEENLFEVGVGYAVGTGRLFQLGNVTDLTIRRNTAVTNQHGFVLADDANDRLTITGNLIRAGNYGMSGASTTTLATVAPGVTFAGNVLATAQASRILPGPPRYLGNTYPGALPLALDALLAAFPAVGADLDAVRAAVAGVVIPLHPEVP